MWEAGGSLGRQTWPPSYGGTRVCLGSVCPLTRALDLGSKEQKAPGRDLQASSLFFHSHLPMVPVTIHILVMQWTRHGSDPALPGPTLPQAVRGREMREKPCVVTFRDHAVQSVGSESDEGRRGCSGKMRGLGVSLAKV